MSEPAAVPCPVVVLLFPVVLVYRFLLFFVTLLTMREQADLQVRLYDAGRVAARAIASARIS